MRKIFKQKEKCENALKDLIKEAEQLAIRDVGNNDFENKDLLTRFSSVERINYYTREQEEYGCELLSNLYL